MKRADIVKHYEINLGANCDEENLAKLKNIYNKLKARLILRDIEKYSEDVQEEILQRLREDVSCKDTI